MRKRAGLSSRMRPPRGILTTLLIYLFLFLCCSKTQDRYHHPAVGAYLKKMAQLGSQRGIFKSYPEAAQMHPAYVFSKSFNPKVAQHLLGAGSGAPTTPSSPIQCRRTNPPMLKGWPATCGRWSRRGASRAGACGFKPKKSITRNSRTNKQKSSNAL